MITREEHLRKIEEQLQNALKEAERDIEELDDQVKTFGESADSAEGADNHPGDDSDRISEQERLLTIRGQLAERKSEIEYALTKVGRESFGMCERCGKAIPKGRLEALPFARYCVECQEILDREEAMTT